MKILTTLENIFSLYGVNVRTAQNKRKSKTILN